MKTVSILLRLKGKITTEIYLLPIEVRVMGAFALAKPTKNAVADVTVVVIAVLNRKIVNEYSIFCN